MSERTVELEVLRYNPETWAKQRKRVKSAAG